MIIGLVGIGTVGGALRAWFETYTTHELRLFDPAKGHEDDFRGIDCAFVSIPVRPAQNGQDIHDLVKTVNTCKQFTDKVFIRSTVLPGTCDSIGAIACPEFLTARQAYQDMVNLPILVGEVPYAFVAEVFPGKPIVQMLNREAELAKFAHNCMGAIKVTFFNLVQKIATTIGADYDRTLEGVLMSGHINDQHTEVPGPDGKFGYGGTCFPENMEALRQFLTFGSAHREVEFLRSVQILNQKYRLEQSEVPVIESNGVEV